MQRVYVYELLDPGVYIRGRTQLVELFSVWTGSPCETRIFEVSPAGMIHFADHGELWRDSEERRALPETAEQALQEAERFLNDIRVRFEGGGDSKNRLSDSRRTKKILQVCPVPERWVRVDAVAVLHPRLGLIDHWLCRFNIELEAFAKPLKPAHSHSHELVGHDHAYGTPDTEPASTYLRVQDALIEVRIGSHMPRTDRYRIIGYNQRWRPAMRKGRIRTELYPVPAPAAGHAHDHGAGQDTEQAEPELVYVLDADSQRYLAPYYVGMSGHHNTFSPASEFSLVLNAIQQDGPDSTSLYLDITGGHPKQEFEVYWSYWRPDTVVTDGIVYVGKGRQLKDLPHAVYNVIADVIDMRTGQTKRHQQMVFAGTLAASIRHLEEQERPVT